MRYLLTLTIAVVFLVVASPALAWRSNEFVSPSGNIHCEFLDYDAGVTCMLANNRRQVTVSAIGRGYRVYNWPDPYVTYRYVLGYGRTWSANPFYCRSFTSAMVCGNRWTGHGFSIARQGIRVW